MEIQGHSSPWISIELGHSPIFGSPKSDLLNPLMHGSESAIIPRTRKDFQVDLILDVRSTCRLEMKWF
jgi:hypothetical protein